KRTSAGPFEDTLRSGTRKGGGYGGGMRGSMGGYGGGYGEMGGSVKTGGPGGAGGYGGMGLDGDSMAANGRPILFHNGKAPGSKFDQNGDNSRFDSLTIKSSNSDQEPGAVVTIVTGDPVASTKPELTLPSRPMSDASGPSSLPALKVQAESTDSHVVWDETKGGKRPDGLWGSISRNKNEAVFNKLDDELDSKGHQAVGEKAKPVVPPYGKVVEYSWQGKVSPDKPSVPPYGDVWEAGRQGDVSKEEEESSISDSEVISGSGTEEHFKELLESTDEIESLLKKVQSTGSDSQSPMGGEVDKKESGGRRGPILGDIPTVGGLFRSDGKKKQLSKERIVDYLEEKQIAEGIEPKRESVSAAIQTQPDPNLEYDEQSVVDRTGILPREDEPDL
ncbi:unnamed protein product, partial [marine sediment metagenome]